MEAQTLTHAQRRGLFARPSPLLRLQPDEKLVALTRRGQQAAFETLVSRYQSRLLGFCRQMLGSTEDAEDVLQEVFVAAYNAMVADERPINVKPWLYRIARNRSLNHLRKPRADGQDSMDTHAHMNGVSTHERVAHREEFRSLLNDVTELPETQRTALLLREIDALSYDEIAKAMETTVPGVKSLLVRARIALAESTEARRLSCEEVRVSLAEAAEGLAKASGPVRRHVKTCDTCRAFRKQLRSDSKVLAAIAPFGALGALKTLLAGKLSGAGAAGGAATTTSGTSGAVLGGATAVGGGAVSSGAGAVGVAIGTKAAAGLATAALLTAGAVEVGKVGTGDGGTAITPVTRQDKPRAAKAATARLQPQPVRTAAASPAPVDEIVVEPVAEVPAKPVSPTASTDSGSSSPSAVLVDGPGAHNNSTPAGATTVAPVGCTDGGSTPPATEPQPSPSPATAPRPGSPADSGDEGAATREEGTTPEPQQPAPAPEPSC